MPTNCKGRHGNAAKQMTSKQGKVRVDVMLGTYKQRELQSVADSLGGAGSGAHRRIRPNHSCYWCWHHAVRDAEIVTELGHYSRALTADAHCCNDVVRVQHCDQGRTDRCATTRSHDGSDDTDDSINNVIESASSITFQTLSYPHCPDGSRHSSSGPTSRAGIVQVPP